MIHALFSFIFHSVLMTVVAQYCYHLLVTAVCCVDTAATAVSGEF